jgi:hypothetical protein
MRKSLVAVALIVTDQKPLAPAPPVHLCCTLCPDGIFSANITFVPALARAMGGVAAAAAAVPMLVVILSIVFLVVIVLIILIVVLSLASILQDVAPPDPVPPAILLRSSLYALYLPVAREIIIIIIVIVIIIIIITIATLSALAAIGRIADVILVRISAPTFVLICRTATITAPVRRTVFFHPIICQLLGNPLGILHANVATTLVVARSSPSLIIVVAFITAFQHCPPGPLQLPASHVENRGTCAFGNV